MDLCFVLFLLCLSTCVCVCRQVQGPLRECLRAGRFCGSLFLPPLFVPDAIGGLAVWRHNNPKKKRGRYAVNLSAVNWEFGHFESQHPFFVTVPKNCTILVYFHPLVPIPSPKVDFISTSIYQSFTFNCTYMCWDTRQWSYGSDMCAGLIFPTSEGLGLVQTSFPTSRAAAHWDTETKVKGTLTTPCV